MSQIIICLDPGTHASGFVIMKDGAIESCGNPENALVFQAIKDQFHLHKDILVLYEDIQPRRGDALTQNGLDTVKFTGVLEYRMQEAGIHFKPIYRWQVKQWCWDNYTELLYPRIETKIKRKRENQNKQREKEGKPPITTALRKPSFVWMGDREVIVAMKEYWSIETPKPGKSNRYDLRKDAWQALALYNPWKESLEVPRIILP
jgi:hypothetical protein